MFSSVFLAVAFIYVYLYRVILENNFSIPDFIFVNKILCFARPVIHMIIIRYPILLCHLNICLILLSYIFCSYVYKYMFLVLSLITLNAMSIQWINNNAYEKESLFAGYFLSRRIITFICTLLLATIAINQIANIFAMLMIFMVFFQVASRNNKVENDVDPILVTQDSLNIIWVLSFFYFLLDVAHFFIIKSCIGNASTAILTSVVMLAIILKRHSKIASATLLAGSFVYFTFIGNLLTPFLIIFSSYASVKTKTFLSDSYKKKAVSINSSSTLIASFLTFIFLSAYTNMF